MDQFFVPKSNSIDLSSHTLILPCVSVGNVPQLTCDLLISTLINIDEQNIKLIGHINSDGLMPVAGPDPYKFCGDMLATSCQVFLYQPKKLVIIQQRAPCFKESKNNFFKLLTEWIKNNNFGKVIVISSSFLEHFSSNLTSREEFPIRFLTTDSFSNNELEILKENHKINQVELVDPFTLTPSSNGSIHLPGSGSLKRIIKSFNEQNIIAIGLVMYCSEGDNRPHAMAFADLVNKWIKIIDGKPNLWITPFSWRKLFGDELPENLY